MGQVTFDTQKQWYEFVDSLGTEIDLLYVIYLENHNKCYLFTDTCKSKSAHLSIIHCIIKFVICKDRHLYISKLNVDISWDENFNCKITICALRQNMKSVKEGKDRFLSKQSEENKKREFKILDSWGWDDEEENGHLGLSLLAVATGGEFEEILEQLQRLYVKEGRRFHWQMKLKFTTVRSQTHFFQEFSLIMIVCHRILGKILIGSFQKAEGSANAKQALSYFLAWKSSSESYQLIRDGYSNCL